MLLSRRLERFAEDLAYSSLLAASIGFGLSSVASHALKAPQPARWALLAAAGTYMIYALDRLRDTDRDRESSPARTAFIERKRPILTSGVAVAAIAFGALIVSAPSGIIVLCAAIGALGLLHRRLKGEPLRKMLYVSLAWVGCCVGVPWLAAGRPAQGLWLAAMLSMVLVANLIGSNLPSQATPLAVQRRVRALRVARGIALLAALLTLCGPRETVPVVWIALAEALALLRFREGERYALVVVDGALAVGCLAAGLHQLILAV